MKKLLLIPVLLSMAMLSHSQFIHKIKADSVLITNDSCNAELNLENSTKDTLGFLYNKRRTNLFSKSTHQFFIKLLNQVSRFIYISFGRGAE